MTIDLTAIFQAIIALLAAIITYKVIPWIKARTTAEEQEMLKATIKTLVFAAEQMYGAGKGAEKLDWVIAQLKERGYSAHRTEIEATVGEYINNYPELIELGEGETADKPPEE